MEDLSPTSSLKLSEWSSINCLSSYNKAVKTKQTVLIPLLNNSSFIKFKFTDFSCSHKKTFVEKITQILKWISGLII